MDIGVISIVMNENEVCCLGIDYWVDGKLMVVFIVSGILCGWWVILDWVKIGGIELLGVEVVVIEGGYLIEVLFGMSFFNWVCWCEE